MLNRVEASNSQGAMLSLPLEDISGGYVIEEINGLDPVKATLVSSSFANRDGSQYQSSRREDRNITLRIGLEPDYVSSNVQGLRKGLYRVFMPKTEVKLRFHMTDGVVDIWGRVESLETALFTQEPAVDISIICFDPDFIDPTPVEVPWSTTDSTVDPATLLTINYLGTIETGIELVMNLNRSLNEFTIYHRLPDNSLQILEFAAPLVAGDVLTLSTISGAKGATLSRAGIVSSLLYGISPQSKWIELVGPGENYIRVYAGGAAIPLTIKYSNRYGGL